MTITKIEPNEKELITALKLTRLGNNVPLSQRVQSFYDLIDKSMPQRGYSWSMNEEDPDKFGKSLTSLVNVVEPFKGDAPWPSEELINIENLKYEDVRKDVRLLSNPLRKIGQVSVILGGFALGFITPFFLDLRNGEAIMSTLPGMILGIYGYYSVVFDCPKPKGYTEAIVEFTKLYNYAQKADSAVLESFGTRGM